MFRTRFEGGRLRGSQETSTSVFGAVGLRNWNGVSGQKDQKTATEVSTDFPTAGHLVRGQPSILKRLLISASLGSTDIAVASEPKQLPILFWGLLIISIV